MANAMVDLTYSMSAKTRMLNHGFGPEYRALFKKAVVDIVFDDTDGLTITAYLDKTRLTAICSYSQSRQSGMPTSGSNAYRHSIDIYATEKFQEYVDYFELLVSKIVPSDGDIELLGQRMLIKSGQIEDEFSGVFADPTGETTFIVEQGATPEEDAYAPPS